MKTKLNTKIDIKRPAKRFFLKPNAVQGFTLIEVLIAMFLLAVAIFAIISTTPLLIKENALDKMATTATTLAKDKMESLKNQSYVGYSGLTTGTDYAPSAPSATDSFYTRTWTITADSPAAKMKTIAVTVSWSWMGVTKNVSLNTIVGE
jgi:prepilin-type N-terminal cleavage/methylation domain-containing protein